MDKYKILIIFFIIFSSCDDSKSGKNTGKNTLSEKETIAKIKKTLINSKINLSQLDSALPYNLKIVKLDQHLYAFSGSVELTARRRGLLWENGKVLTSLRVFINTTEEKTNKTYATLFDEKAKKMINFVLLGSNLSVVSVIESESDDSIIEFSALVREGGRPAKKVKTFKVEIKNNKLTLL